MKYLTTFEQDENNEYIIFKKSLLFNEIYLNAVHIH